MSDTVRLTAAEWTAFGKLYNDGPVEYHFTPFRKAVNGNRVANLDEAMRYRVEGIRPAVVEKLIETGMVTARPVDDKRGTLLVDIERAADYDHVMDLLEKIGIRQITEKNFAAVWERFVMWERAHDLTRVDENGDDRWTVIDEVWVHVNLANPHVISKTNSQFHGEIIRAMSEIATMQVITFRGIR